MTYSRPVEGSILSLIIEGSQTMKVRLFSLGLVLPLLLAAQPDAPAPELKAFASREGGFTVLLPGTPREQALKHKGPDGREVVSYTFVVERTPAAYTIAYASDPNLAKADLDAINVRLEKVRKGLESSLNGKLVGERKITLEKHPGLEFHLELAGTSFYRSRIYIVRDRFFQVTVLGPREVALSPESNAILDSFQLLK
jgi:hypothetical protein